MSYVVFTKKLFHLKNGLKESVSRRYFKTLKSARRFKSIMLSRNDVIEVWIN